MHRLRSLVPSANYLFVFEAAARRKSFTAAAHELNVSQPAVSKTIRLLELATDLKLFRRDSSRLELTAEGLRLYHEIQQSFDHLHDVLSTLRNKHSKDIVRVSFSTTFIQLWLLPRLNDFKSKHPDVSLRVEESTRDDEDLDIGDIDLSARLGTGDWPGLKSWKLAAEEVFPVCSPAYLQRSEPFLDPGDLHAHTLLHTEELHRTRLGWSEWLSSLGVPFQHLRHDSVFTDPVSSIHAAALGQGVALGWKHLVRDHLKAGHLVRPVNNVYRSGQFIWLVMSAHRPAKKGTILFRDWILGQDADDPLDVY